MARIYCSSVLWQIIVVVFVYKSRYMSIQISDTVEDID